MDNEIIRLFNGADGLWIQCELNGKAFGINLQSERLARSFALEVAKTFCNGEANTGFVDVPHPDTKRLDWLIDQMRTVDFYNITECSQQQDSRQAIDEAMEGMEASK